MESPPLILSIRTSLLPGGGEQTCREAHAELAHSFVNDPLIGDAISAFRFASTLMNGSERRTVIARALEASSQGGHRHWCDA